MVGPKALAARWSLLCALAFAVIGLHHLASMCHHDDEPTVVVAVIATPLLLPAAPADDCCDGMPIGEFGVPPGSHDLLHLCLAILVAGLALGMLLARWRVASLLPQPTTVRRRSPRPPPGSAALLISLGVLRQ